MTDDFDWEAFGRSMAEVMALSVRSEWWPTVVANLRATATLAELVLCFPLPDAVEPAPVFEA